jgi:hypothetical protein
MWCIVKLHQAGGSASFGGWFELRPPRRPAASSVVSEWGPEAGELPSAGYFPLPWWAGFAVQCAYTVGVLAFAARRRPEAPVAVLTTVLPCGDRHGGTDVPAVVRAGRAFTAPASFSGRHWHRQDEDRSGSRPGPTTSGTTGRPRRTRSSPSPWAATAGRYADIADLRGSPSTMSPPAGRQPTVLRPSPGPGSTGSAVSRAATVSATRRCAISATMDRNAFSVSG